MPCNSVITVTVEMGATTDTGLLMAALKRAKASPSRLEDGSLSFELDGARGRFDAKAKRLDLVLGRFAMRDAIVNKVKAAYSYEVVMSAVRRVGAAAATSAGAPNVIHVRLAEGG